MSVKHPEYLEAEIVLDNPEYLHHGNGKAVTGHLALTYHCVESASELSGVLIASVIFRGRTKAEIKTGQGSKWITGSSTWYGKLTPYTSEDILFDFSREIHNGPFRATCNKTVCLQFVLNFPSCVQRPVNSKGWDPTKLLSSQVDEQLPPSDNCKYESESVPPDPIVNASIEYRVGAQVTIRDNAIPICGVGEASLPQVHYKRGYTSPSEGLMVYDCPRKSVFDYVPYNPLPLARGPQFRCVCTMHCPQTLYLDQPIVVKIVVIPLDGCPDFTAKAQIDMDLESFTEVHAGNTLGRSRKGCFKERYRVAGYEYRVDDQQLELLSKANGYSIAVTSKSISGVPSTFFTRAMSRWYTLIVQISFEGLPHNRDGFRSRCLHSIPVLLMPPVAGCVPTKPGLRPTDYRSHWSREDGYVKPNMPDMASMPAGNAVLPKYEQPPSYDTLSKEKAEGCGSDTKTSRGKVPKGDQ
ncbi:hypothetical protein B0A48_11035 [Cryoendolithus antarcticus]|uniref:Arrestin-like N-terminal domain-containing protein n=1 Tax=Cryoendolithus antarcticus TaxID=1507870 RepID=A0A1V8SUB7_9PEZI|nr:hypothetical protein B0A48_11035 [Cryoendolithus antarcticus]